MTPDCPQAPSRRSVTGTRWQPGHVQQSTLADDIRPISAATSSGKIEFRDADSRPYQVVCVWGSVLGLRGDSICPDRAGMHLIGTAALRLHLITEHAVDHTVILRAVGMGLDRPGVAPAPHSRRRRCRAPGRGQHGDRHHQLRSPSPPRLRARFQQQRYRQPDATSPAVSYFGHGQRPPVGPTGKRRLDR